MFFERQYDFSAHKILLQREKQISESQFSMFLWDQMHLKNQSIEGHSVLHMFCFLGFNQAVNEQKVAT